MCIGNNGNHAKLSSHNSWGTCLLHSRLVEKAAWRWSDHRLGSPRHTHGSLNSVLRWLLPFVKPVWLPGGSLELAGGLSRLQTTEVTLVPHLACRGVCVHACIHVCVHGTLPSLVGGLRHCHSPIRADINRPSLTIVQDPSLKSPKNYMAHRIF